MGFAEREQIRQTKGVAASMISHDQNECQSNILDKPQVKRETKKRYNFTISPSLYNDMKKIAYIERRSISDILSALLDEYVKKHQEDLHEYEQMKND